MSKPYPANNIGPGCPYTIDEWRKRYERIKLLTEELKDLLHAEARQMCADAGLDPNLLGIHPHNAMCSLSYGNPWKDVDYNLVQICLDLCHIYPSRLLAEWDKAVRGNPFDRQQEERKKEESAA